MRFGIVGTGTWARLAHLPGLHAATGAEPVAVWGRDPAKVQAFAREEGLTACTEVDELLGTVDAVAFAVPPPVQVEVGIRAAAAGKHLLLEKPLALDNSGAEALESAVAEAGVASVVFVTATYTPEWRAWLRELTGNGQQRGATAVVLSSALTRGGPFDTPWRREKGALWDIGPHVLAALEGALGPVTEVAAAVPGAGALVHLVLRHDGGATSTATLSIGAGPAVARSEVVVWGEGGTSSTPPLTSTVAAAYAVAVDELLATARSGEQHPYGVSDGRRVVALLSTAQRLLDAQASPR